MPYYHTGRINETIPSERKFGMVVVDKTALTLAIIGALNWGSIGVFGFDIVAWIFGGQNSIGARIIYTVVALAGIWCISVLFRSWRGITERDTDDETAAFDRQTR